MTEPVFTPGFLSKEFFIATCDGRNGRPTQEIQYRARNGALYRFPADDRPMAVDADGASTPPALWGPPINLPPFGPWWKAAFGLHDPAYRGLLEWWNPETKQWEPAPITRKDADDLLLEAMELDNVEPKKREEIYLGVRAGGASSWKPRNQPATTLNA